LEGIVLEHLEDGCDQRSAFAKNSQRLFRTAAEHTLDSRHTKAIDDVLRETEGDELWDRETSALRRRVSERSRRARGWTYLVERDPEIDLHELSLDLVHEDVGRVPVSKSDDVSDDGSRRDAPRVVGADVEPEGRELVLLEEEVAHDGRELVESVEEVLVLGDVPVRRVACGCATFGGLDRDRSCSGILGTKACLGYEPIDDMPSVEVERKGNGDSLCVEREESIGERLGVVDELNDSRESRERDDLVRAESKVAPPCAVVAVQEGVDEIERLLHHGVLSDVVLALELHNHQASVNDSRDFIGYARAACTPSRRSQSR
jgi:hypothetical protein